MISIGIATEAKTEKSGSTTISLRTRMALKQESTLAGCVRRSRPQGRGDLAIPQALADDQRLRRRCDRIDPRGRRRRLPCPHQGSCDDRRGGAGGRPRRDSGSRCHAAGRVRSICCRCTSGQRLGSDREHGIERPEQNTAGSEKRGSAPPGGQEGGLEEESVERGPHGNGSVERRRQDGREQRRRPHRKEERAVRDRAARGAGTPDVSATSSIQSRTR